MIQKSSWKKKILNMLLSCGGKNEDISESDDSPRANLDSRKANNLQNDGRDVISDLSDDLKHEILLRLPLKQAGRTSVLSKNWRYIWTRLPPLINGHEFNREVQESPLASKGMLIAIMCKVIRFYPAPLIKIDLSIPGFQSCPDENFSIVEFLLKNGIEVSTYDLINIQDRFSSRSLDHLREIQIENISGLIHEVEFIKFLLGHCRSLKKLIITGADGFDCEGMTEFWKRLLRFRLATPGRHGLTYYLRPSDSKGGRIENQY